MIKKSFRLAAAVLLAVIAAVMLIFVQGCACSKEEQPTPTEVEITVEPATEAPTEPAEEATAEPTAEPVPEAGNEFPTRDGSVTAIATGTYGVASDGSVRFMGRSVSGQCYIGGWQGVVQLAASDNTTVALLEDGSLLMTGEHAEDFAEAEEWQDIVSIAVGEAHLVGLKADGTVVAVGDNSSGQCRVQDWERVTAVYAVDNFTVGLTDRFGAGVLDTKHGADIASLPENLQFVDAAPASDHIALLSSEGDVYTLRYSEPVTTARVDGSQGASTVRDAFAGTDWHGIAKVFAAEGATYCIDGEGHLYTDSELIDTGMADSDALNNIYTLSAAKEHVVLLHSDGTAAGFGSNEDLQCNVDNWRLLPYITEEGYLIGYSEGDIVGDELYRTGLELSFGDPVTEEVNTVTAVLLGDLNGDGAIDEADYELISAHIKGSEQLEGAYLRAANIISDSAKPDAVDIVDKDALRRHLDGKCPIDQYAKTDMYTTKLANAKRVNTDALGYITLSGTNIDYPIMYGDNWYYHSRGLDGKNLERGSIYTYWSTPNKNIVITGHNARTSGTMLHQLHYIQDNYARNFDTYKNRLWCINAYGTTGYWEVWSMYEEGAFKNANDSSLVYNTCFPSTMGAMSETQVEAWIQYQQNKSQLNYHVDVTTDDTFITIVTCGDTHYASELGSRLYFFLRWVSGN